MNRKRCIVIALLVICYFGKTDTAYCQSPYSYSFTDKYKLPVRTVYYIHEDKNRNMWFATNEGLYKWNGQSITKFQHPSFATEYTYIQEDPEGQIWCQNFTGQIFHTRGDSLVLFSDQTDRTISFMDYTLSNFPDVFITTDHGIVRVEYSTKKSHEYNNAPYPDRFTITERGDTLFYNPTRHIIAMDSGLTYYRSGHILRRTFSTTSDESVVSSLARIKLRFRSEPYLVSLNNQLLILGNRTRDKTAAIYTLEGDSIRLAATLPGILINTASIFFDKTKQRYFIGSSSGIHVFDMHWNRVLKGPLLPEKNVSAILRDQEGNYWISTLNDGIFIIPSLEILSYSNHTVFSTSPATQLIRSSDHHLYVICENGKVFKYQSSDFLKVGDFHQMIEIIHYNPQNQWITSSNLSSSMDLKTGQLHPNTSNPGIKKRTPLNQTDFLISSSANASIQMANTNNFQSKAVTTIFPLKESLKYSSKFNQLYAPIREKRSNTHLMQQHLQSAYIGYSDGLFFYQKNKEFPVLSEDGKSFVPISMETCSDSSGVWVTTTQNKLLKIYKDHVISETIIPDNAHNIISWKNYLFLATNRGVLKLDTLTKNITTINQADGLPSDNVLDCEKLDDTLFIATDKDLTKLPCSYEYDNTTMTPLFLDRVEIWGNSQIILPSYELKYDENNISVFFHILATRNPDATTVQYRMTGLNNSWIEQSGGIHFVRFPNLPYGDFSFEIRTKNEDGYLSDIQRIPFHLNAPYYLKWWFFVLLTLVVILLVSGVFLIRIRIIHSRNKILQDKKEIEKQLSDSQLTALRSQMNPHFVFNALNSIQDYIISNNKELASDYLGLFADLIRKYLHYGEEHEITIEDELETLEMYLTLEKVRFEETLQYRIEDPDSLRHSQIKIPVMLIQPFVENSIKHGLLHKKGERLLNIHLEQTREFLIIRITDNGIGREASARINKLQNKTHKSFATSTLQKRIDLLNQNENTRISVRYSDLNPGTEVCISILL